MHSQNCKIVKTTFHVCKIDGVNSCNMYYILKTSKLTDHDVLSLLKYPIMLLEQYSDNIV